MSDAGPIVLFRAWRLIPGKPELYGVYRRYAWRPREQRAKCILKREETPMLRRLQGEPPLPKHDAPADPNVHRCGFGGYYTLEDVFKRFALPGKVFGAFLAYGSVIRGSLAVRTEMAAPLALFDDTTLQRGDMIIRSERSTHRFIEHQTQWEHERRQRMIAAYAERYAIPALGWDGLMRDVVRFGELLQPTTGDSP